MNNVYIHQIQNNSSKHIHLLFLNNQDSSSFDAFLAPNHTCDYKKLGLLAAVIPQINNSDEFSSTHLRLHMGDKVYAVYNYKNQICFSETGKFIENAPSLNNYIGQTAINLIIEEDETVSAQTHLFINRGNLASASWYTERYAIYGLYDDSIMGKAYDTKYWDSWRADQLPSESGFKGQLSALSWSTSTHGLFLLGNDNYIYQRTSDFIKWQPWVKHAPPLGIELLGIATTSWANNRYGIYAVGNNGQLYERYYNQSLSEWSSLGAPKGVKLTELVTAVSWISSRFGIYAVGNDGQVWQKWYKTTNWSSWESLGKPRAELKSLTSCWWATNKYFIGGVCVNGDLHVRHYDPLHGWHAWQKITAPSGVKLNGRLTAVKPTKGRYQIIAEDENNILYLYENDKWGILNGR